MEPGDRPAYGPGGGSAPADLDSEVMRRFAERLVDRGVLTVMELGMVERTAAERGLALADAVVALGLATEEQAGSILAEELEVPYVFPYAQTLDQELVSVFPEALLRRHEVVPFVREAGQIVLATPRLPGMEARRELEAACGSRVAFSLAGRRFVARALHDLFGPPPAVQAGEGERREREDGLDPGAVVLLYGHLARAIEEGATEVRFEPGPDAIAVRYRVGGRLVERAREPAAWHLALVSRARVLAGSAPADDGRGAPAAGFRRAVRTCIAGRDLTLEVAILPTRTGESVLLRLVAESRRPGRLEDLGLGAAADAAIRSVAAATRGLVVVASGDLVLARGVAYALLRVADPAARAVVAVERQAFEPEPLFRQVELGGLSPGEALAAALGHEPDVLLVDVPLEAPADLRAALGAAEGRLVVVVAGEPHAADALIGWIEAKARRSVLARVLGALVTAAAPAGGVQVEVAGTGAELRDAIEAGGPPGRIRAAASASASAGPGPGPGAGPGPGGVGGEEG